MARFPESSVLDMSMAMVMGPTPPGTGVILLATLTASSKSTSPVRRYPAFFEASGTELVPTSMMAAPFLIQFFLTMCALPAAAMMKELTARFVVAYDKADFDMIAGLLAMDKLDVTHMCTGTVGFKDFSEAERA